ncbi:MULTISPECIES: hypothetical protein [Bacillus]|uniref:hypothetical protein n=1 Tax=Bacillus TaxID=1386 RepID=UPI000BB7FA7C|nr:MULTISPECIES: hypothetical protein [Bacillus]
MGFLSTVLFFLLLTFLIFFGSYCLTHLFQKVSFLTLLLFSATLTILFSVLAKLTHILPTLISMATLVVIIGQWSFHKLTLSKKDTKQG